MEIRKKNFCLNCSKESIKPKFCSKRCYGQYKSKNTISIKKEDLVRLYVNEKKTLVETASILGKSIQTVIKYAKKYDIKLNGHYYIDYCGQTIGNILVLEPIFPGVGTRGKHVKWKCKCLLCDKHCILQSHALKLLVNQSCSECSYKITAIKKTKNSVWTWIIKAIKLRVKKKRNCGRYIEYNLNENILINMMEKQNGKCALTGIDLKLSKTTFEHVRENKTTVSVDRIDNSRGYTEDNIRLVHKNINLMRQDNSDEDFIYWCNLVARKFPKNNSYLDDYEIVINSTPKELIDRAKEVAKIGNFEFRKDVNNY